MKREIKRACGCWRLLRILRSLVQRPAGRRERAKAERSKKGYNHEDVPMCPLPPSPHLWGDDLPPAVCRVPQQACVCEVFGVDVTTHPCSGTVE